MASIPLVFGRSPVTAQPVRLIFGETDAPPAPGAVTLAGGGQITGLRLRVAARAAVQAQGQGTVTGFRLRIASRFDINVSRPTVGSTQSLWQDAAPQQHAARSAWQQATPLPVGTHSHWQDADAVAASLRAVWNDSLQAQRTLHTLFEQASRLPTEPTRSSYQEAQRLRSDTISRFQEATRLPGAPLVGRFQETYRDRQARVGSIFQVADKLAVRIASGMGIAVRLPLGFGGRFQEACPPRPGQWQRPGPPLPEPCYTPALPAHLVFSDPHDASLPTRLVFVCERHGPGPEPEPGATVVVPIQRTYMVFNDASLRRVDGNIHLPTFSMSLSLDAGSWTWGFSASLPASTLPDLLPAAFGTPVELEAMVNGTPYRLLAESISRERVFGAESLRVSGRGLSALLDAPYAPSQNFSNAADRTAQQLMADVLTDNGVPMGWAVDWKMTDWLVPAGAWSHQGSFISALNVIAGAAGGYVQPHASAPTLHIANMYPTAPWDWGSVTPDFELPADLAVQEGISWRENAIYNRVFVSGSTAAGVLGEVTRAGTAGDRVAQMVVDPLITHVDAARQRGLHILAPSGTQAMVGLSLPVLELTGVIPPGKTVRYVDGAVHRTGIVRSVQVDVGLPEITQRIEVETYA